MIDSGKPQPFIATAIPYEQHGVFKSLYYRLFPRTLTLADFETSLNSHLFCLGTSGSGKSRFITALAIAEIEASHSVFLIDTSQDPFRQVLSYCIEANIDPAQVIILDATAPFPVPDLHLFDVPPGIFEDSVVDGFIAAQRGFLGDSFGERQADVLRMLAYTFIKANAPFLPYSIQFLTQENIRNAILKRANDKTLTDFWQRMTKQKSYSTVIESSRNKLNALAMNTLVNQYFDSNQSTIDLYEVFKAGKIILLNLSENHYKDRSSRALLGLLFLFLAHQALLRRELDPEADKTPTALILDEAHQYYVSDFVLPFYIGTRKHGVGIKLFSQSCNNFPPNDVDIILATASHLVSFGIGARDAERIVKDLGMPTDEHFVKRVQRDLYGAYGEKMYCGVSVSRENTSQRRLCGKISGKCSGVHAQPTPLISILLRRLMCPRTEWGRGKSMRIGRKAPVTTWI